ncbi:MAG: VWA domain-containing protein [Acidobacteria bacterium]|nr:VWA domain-containing protein [Acidobacteriota bacterium]
MKSTSELSRRAAFSWSLIAFGQAPPMVAQLVVNVDFVVLHTTVRNAKGQLALALSQGDFTVYEDGARQSIRLFKQEDSPVSVGLVVDHSGTMRRKIVDVVAAVKMFVASSNKEDELFVVNFNENVTLGLPAAMQFTKRFDELTRAIANTPASGQTALYDAIAVALERLQPDTREKKALIVISDGGDNASKLTLAEVLVLAERSNVVLYTLGIFEPTDPDRNPGALKRLAAATGGDAYFPATPEAIVTTAERIAREIRSQYIIGYSSSSVRPPNAYRKIRVAADSVERGKLTVRARAGYRAAPAVAK